MSSELSMVVIALWLVAFVMIEIAAKKALRWIRKMLTKTNSKATMGDDFGEQG